MKHGAALQKTLRDGHFKALQGKLELLERLCRALQKERNDLNNRLSLLQEQGDKEATAPPEDQPQEPLAGEEEEEDDAKGLAQSDRPETEAIHQAPRPPETDPPLAATDETTTTAAASTSSQPAETATTQQDWVKVGGTAVLHMPPASFHNSPDKTIFNGIRR